MLETGDLSAKCADLNGLHVGLARAAGLPARDVYGVRIARSDLGYKSLGVSTEVITKATTLLLPGSTTPPVGFLIYP